MKVASSNSRNRVSIDTLALTVIRCLPASLSHTLLLFILLLPSPTACVCSVEDIEQQKKQDSDSGVGSDNGDKRLEVLANFLLKHALKSSRLDFSRYLPFKN